MGQQQHTPEPWRLHDADSTTIMADTKSGEVKLIADCGTSRNNTFSEMQSNTKRIVSCVNAMAGKPAPERWVSEAEAILNSIYSFEHPQLKLGSSKVEVLLQMAKEREQLLEQLKRLLHMHSCEQEGIIMPTAAQWFHAVNEAEEVAFKIDPTPYNPNE